MVVRRLALCPNYPAGARLHARTRATLDTTGPTFVAFLLGVIVIVGSLIYLPILIWGPPHKSPREGRGDPRHARIVVGR
jgi:K+-transporting ATPase A subunit